MLFKKTLLAAAVLAFGGFAVSASAGTANTTMGVKIVIQNACNVVTAPTNLDFGTSGPMTATINEATAGNISVTCTTGASYNVALDKGGNGTSITTRAMKSTGAALIGYQLYSDAARSVVWGDVVGTSTVASTGTGVSQSFPVYGKVLAQTTPAAGTYSDTVNVVITY